MARDVTDDNYYMASKGKIPVKWTAPEVIFFKYYNYILSKDILYRHYFFKDTQFRVMYGVMGVSYMKYGVLDISHLKSSTLLRLVFDCEN